MLKRFAAGRRNGPPISPIIEPLPFCSALTMPQRPASPCLYTELRADDCQPLPDGSAHFTFSPELTAYYERPHAALWSVWKPRGVPCFSVGLLHDLERASHLLERYFAASLERPLTHIVLRSSTPGVFNLGGDLGHFLRLIDQQNRPRLIEYARSSVNVVYRNSISHNLPAVTMVALLEGDALGGGFESALSCDVIVAEEQVRLGFPEVLFDMFPGMGGLSFLPRRGGLHALHEVARSGRLFSAAELHAMGVIDQVVETGSGEAAVRRLLRQRAGQAMAHVAMNGVERSQLGVSRRELGEIVRRWTTCALELSERGRGWMRRLHEHQVATYGRQFIAGLGRIDAPEPR